MSTSKEVFVTIFSKTLRLVGDIVTKGDLRIEGKIDGSILCGGKVVIDKDAEVHGPVHADSVELLGSCNGEIFAHQGITLAKTAKLKGNLTTRNLSIDNEAIIEGTIQINKNLPGLDYEGVRNKRKVGEKNIAKLSLNTHWKKNTQSVENEENIYGEGWI
ncbi:bactofilin family protein [Mongoliitalea lutea]|uniref:Protein CcmA, bactofilin family n=1 Tax=Mongoliitalea lutea TaxID=849756 RepID=A0A8J3CWD3_9BACT|nr:polymer-forming cytoskeletal protein [Mongoliitalea lutea]GHB35342.1 hypothetical protein GCM10008106_15960 [Mongoliitalea lutea]